MAEVDLDQVRVRFNYLHDASNGGPVYDIEVDGAHVGRCYPAVLGEDRSWQIQWSPTYVEYAGHDGLATVAALLERTPR